MLESSFSLWSLSGSLLQRTLSSVSSDFSLLLLLQLRKTLQVRPVLPRNSCWTPRLRPSHMPLKLCAGFLRLSRSGLVDWLEKIRVAEQLAVLLGPTLARPAPWPPCGFVAVCWWERVLPHNLV